MRFLTVEQVLFLHARLIEETGGAHGVRDLSLLESAVVRPQATFGGKDLYPDLFSKAAALMDSLIRNHPFVDGNKRTGIAAAALFLLQNGYRLTATNEELEAFTLYVAESKPEISEIAAWLKAHSARRKGLKISRSVR
ncbi:MAG TPA: type II toxin-antitoxin system death-on-curing family toxin [Thermoflexus sp.]|nr:type II toxin-antitoxin system death-on-curing family toxin [Thermoflexus sp.]